MPQPVHHSKAIDFDFSPERILERPNLAAHIATISAFWNDIEARIAALLAALLGDEAKTGISIFFAITNDGAKRAAIDAICALKLSSDEKAELQRILKTVGERYADRNYAVHGGWGISPQYPDALLWNDVRDTILLFVELARLPGPENKDARKALCLQFQKTMRVWKDHDFVEVEKRMRTAYKELYDFSRPIIDQHLAPIGMRSDSPINRLPRW